MERWRERTLGLTFVLLAASGVLIVPSLAGIGASIPTFVALLAAGAALAALRPRLADLPPVVGYDVGSYVRDIWLGPVVAVGLVLLIEPGASAAELQSIGGIAGLLGMVNYFIRPLYLFGYDLLRRLLARVRAE